MSAFVVDPSTIDRIVGHLLARDIDSFAGIALRSPGGADRLGQALLALNVAAVNCRYREDEPVPEYRHTRRRPRAGYLQVQDYKSIACFLYQCGEGEQFETDPLFVALSKAHDDLAHAIVCGLPSYEKGDWA